MSTFVRDTRLNTFYRQTNPEKHFVILTITSCKYNKIAILTDERSSNNGYYTLKLPICRILAFLLFLLGGSFCRVDRVGAVDDVLLLFLFDAGCRDISIHGE